jgi:hypothetical protein
LSEKRHEYRAYRRSARRSARRRERNKRLLIAVIPVVVIVAVVAAVLVLWGGKETAGQQGAPATVATTETTLPGPTADVAGIVVLQEEEAAALVLLSRRSGGGGVVLGMPGCTLIRTEEGFQTLSESYDKGKKEALVEGLGAHLGVTMGGLAEVRWEALSDMLATAADQIGQPPTLLDDTPEASLKAAEAVLAFAEMMPTVGGDLGKLGFTGDVKTVEYLVAEIARDHTGPAWEAAMLPGRIVEGAGFCYYEPDEVSAGRVIAGRAEGRPEKVTVEIQNGSGVLDAAQAAGDLVASFGYELAPFQNAPGFPDVAKTGIVTGGDTLSEAKKVRAALGVGELREDDMIPPATIRVVLGKDFVPGPAGD